MIHSLPKSTNKQINTNVDAPWCDIRSTHAGYRYLAGLEWPEAKKKERFEMGAPVKSRNEPMAMRYVYYYLHPYYII